MMENNNYRIGAERTNEGIKVKASLLEHHDFFVNKGRFMLEFKDIYKFLSSAENPDKVVLDYYKKLLEAKGATIALNNYFNFWPFVNNGSIAATVVNNPWDKNEAIKPAYHDKIIEIPECAAGIDIEEAIKGQGLHLINFLSEDASSYNGESAVETLAKLAGHGNRSLLKTPNIMYRIENPECGLYLRRNEKNDLEILIADIKTRGYALFTDKN